MDLVLGSLGIIEDLLDWLDGVSEVVGAKVFELSSGDVKGEILSVLKGIDVNLSGVDSGEHSFSSFTLGSESSQSLLVVSDVNTGSLLEVSNAVIDESVVEILSSEMGVSGSGLDFEETVFDRQQGDIESTTSEIEDENESLVLNILVQTVSNGSSGWLVDDSHDIESGNLTSVFGGLSLRVVEVSWDSNDCVLDFLSEIILGNFLHLGQDH